MIAAWSKRLVLAAIRRSGYDLVRRSAAAPVVAAEETATPAEHAASPVRPRAFGLTEAIFGGSWPAPPMPNLVDQVAEKYATYDNASDREIISRAVMGRAIVDDQFSSIMKRAPGGGELYRQLAAAIAFGEGDLEQCLSILDSLRASRPTPFNELCYGRTLIALDRLEAAIAHFDARHKASPSDIDAAMSLTNLLYWKRDIDGANLILSRFTEHFEDERAEVTPRQQELQRAIDQRKVHPDKTEDFYADEEDFVVRTWWGYWRTFGASPFREPNAALESKIRTAVVDRMRTITPGVTTFIDFGAFCGHTVAALAEQFRDVRFIGIDRPRNATQLSERFFKQPNASFVAGDLLEEIDNWNNLGDNVVLFHSRTGVFCYPEYMRQLYQKCRAKGVRHIMCQEAESFSRMHMKFFDYGAYPDISITGRNPFFLHDYERLFREIGFSIVSMTRVDPNLLLDDRSGYGTRHRLVHAVLR